MRQLEVYKSQSVSGSFIDMIKNTKQEIVGTLVTLELSRIKIYKDRTMPIEDFEKLKDFEKRYQEITRIE